MKRKYFLVTGIVVSALVSSGLMRSVSVFGKDYEITIQNGEFSTLSISVHYDNDHLTFRNLDDVERSLRISKLGFNTKQDKLAPASSVRGTTYTPNFDVADVGEWEYWLTSNTAVRGIITVIGDEVSPTPTVTPSSSVTPSPEPTESVSPSPSASSTAMPTESSQPTATPSLSPTPSVSVEPSDTPSPSPSASVESTMTATPTATPTVVPSATANPTATPIPTITPSATPTVAPSATPTPSATPEVLPDFSVFRKTACSARVQGGQVVTDLLGSVRLIRGVWDIVSLSQDDEGVDLEVDLAYVRVVNLFFRGLPFFGADRINTDVSTQISFSSDSLEGVLEDASVAWCRSAKKYR